MPILHLLGTGAAVSDGSRTTTMLAVEDDDSTYLVDCGADAIQRAQANGIDLDTIRALFLTHQHPDHVAGFPLLMERLWLSQRRDPLPIHGPASALDQARRCFDTFDTSSWDDLFELEWRDVALDDDILVLETDQWSVHASPGDHGKVDVLGLRFTDRRTEATITYSADTAPNSSIRALAQNTNILVHEATGQHAGHSTAEQAARVAAQAEVDQLVLVHLPPHVSEGELEDARSRFDGPVSLGRDGDTYEF